MEVYCGYIVEYNVGGCVFVCVFKIWFVCACVFYFVSLGYGCLKTNLTWTIVWSILWIKIKHAQSFL